MAAGAALAVMAVQRTAKAAKTGAKAVNKGTSFGKNLANSKLANNKLVNSAAQKIGDISNKVSKEIQFLNILFISVTFFVSQ